MGRGEASGKGRGGCVSPGEAWEMFKDFGQRVMCGVCCILCTGPILIIIGIFFVVSAIKDKRGENVKKFNEGVGIWNADLPSWESRIFTSPTGVGLTIETTESFEVTDTELTQWQARRFQGSGTPFNSVAATDGSQGTVVFAETGAGDMPPLSVTVHKSVQRSVLSSSTGGKNAPPPPPPPPPQDQWYKVTAACLQVSESVGGGLNNGGGGFGCFSTLSGSNTQDYANGYTYATCGSPVNQGAAAPAVCTGSIPFEVTLRSQNDPIVFGFANDACGRSPSGGSCAFGLSRSAKLLFALLFLAFGICWTCCIYGGAYAAVVYLLKKRKEGQGGGGGKV